MTTFTHETLNEFQKDFLERFFGGEYSYLTDETFSGSPLEERLAACGDTFVRAGLCDLDDVADLDEAVKRMRQVGSDFYEVADAMERNQQRDNS